MTSDHVANLATVHSIFIKSSLSSANVLSTRAGNSTTLQKVSVDVNSLGMIYMTQSDFRQISVISQPVIDHVTFQITDQNDNLLQLNNCNFEFSILFEIFPKYREFNNRRRDVITQRSPPITIPTQPQNIIRDDDLQFAIDETHPIENKTEAKHKSDRIVLDTLLDIVDNQ